MIERYFHTFTIKDWDGFRGSVRVLFTVWRVGRTPDVVTTLDDVVARLRAAREALETTDYAVSKVERMVITPLSANAALVDIHWRRDKKDGALLVEGAEILAVSRTADGWKITANMARTLGQFGKSF